MDNWKKQVNILWWSQLLAISSMEMSEPFWPLFLRQLDPTAENITLWSALIYGAPLLISGLVAPYWGRLGDRYGHKKMLLRASLGLALTQGLLFFSSTLWEVFAYRLLQGALAGMITAVLCFANTIAPEQNRSLVVGKLTSATAGGAILGPLIGGVLIEWLSFQALFALASLICLFITLVLGGLLSNDKSPSTAMKSKKDSHVPTINSHIIWLFLLVIFLLQSAKAIPSSFFALYTEQYLDSTPIVTGLLFSSAGVGMMISAPYWGKLFDQMHVSKRSLVLALVALVSAICYLLHLQNSWLTLLIIRLIWGLCLGAMLPMVQAMMLNLTNQRQHGHVIGQAQRTIKIGNLTGVSLGALLLTLWDYQSGFTVAAILYLVTALALFIISLQCSKPTTEMLIIKR
jgi:MFS family permease